MATASRETTRTERSGCLERTLEASSWTQMETEMRCAMPTSSPANSATPEGGALGGAGAGLTRTRHCFSSVHTARTAEGTLASTTASPSTIPISSSSVRWDSPAASSSSDAMLNDTLNARSLPSEPSAPVVALMPSWVSTEELRQACGEVAAVRGAIAWHGETTVVVRRLLALPIAARATGARGSSRSARARGARHAFQACVFGVLLGEAVQLACFNGHFQRAEVMRGLRVHLEPAAAQLADCEGSDAEHLRAGFASHRVVRAQQLLLRGGRGARRGGGSALGLSACLFFLVCMSAQNARHSGSLDCCGESWLRCAAAALESWRWTAPAAEMEHGGALEAELRALKRGALGLRAARREAARLQLDVRDAVRLQASYLRRATWPSGRRLEAGAQAGLCAWIESADFVADAELPPRRGAWYTHALPLAALADADRDSDSDATSSLGSESSAGSAGSAGSECLGVEGAVEAAEALHKLASFFNSNL